MYINPKAIRNRQLWDAWVHELDGRKVSKRYCERKHKAFEWLKATHWFQYKYNGQPIGKPMKMTGGESRLRNKKLEDRFYKETDPNAHLGRWCWMKERENETSVPDNG